MKWNNCYSGKRTGDQKKNKSTRTVYQRDFDRLIFSSAFRRLQDKTQVFPLPGSAFVHNRLTHSLEVASVGRSLGKLVGDHIADNDIDPKDEESLNFYRNELQSVIASACIAHDVGNPAFGHSGEEAISRYFISNAEEKIDNKKLRSFFTKKEWLDLTTFEGNANALRILTHKFEGKLEGGLRLSYSTLASILKYPCEVSAKDKKYKHRKKFGFFQSEKDIFLDIVTEVGMIKDVVRGKVCFKRHPFVYLVEAADDICYRIIDMEDAHRLGILSTKIVSDAFINIISSLEREEDNIEEIQATLTSISDANNAIEYLRAKSINSLIMESRDVFVKHKKSILQGKFNDTLIDNVEDRCGALKEVNTLSIDKIYNHRSVIEVEISGYKIMSELLATFIPGLLRSKPNDMEEKSLRLLPTQFQLSKNARPYEKAMSIIDYVSGMTDTFAIELYRRCMGIEIAKHR